MLSAFVTWFTSYCKSFLVVVYNACIDLLQGAFDGLMTFIVTIISAFPVATPIPTNMGTPISSTFTVFITCLNWIFPIQFLVTLVGVVASSMIAYLVIAPLARWAKLLT